MKILHLTKKYHPMIGGDAHVTYNLKKQQQNMGHQVHIMVSNCDEISQNDHVLKFGLKESPSNLDKITLRRLASLFILFIQSFGNLNEIKPSIIHSHSADLGFIISFAARFYGIPVINTCHGISFDDKQYCFLKRFAEKFFLKHSSFKKIITIDKKGLKSLEYEGIRNVVHIPNGVDVHKFHFPHNKKSDGITRFLFAGRLEKQKGVEYLLKAVNLLDETEFEVVITGDGEEADRLRLIAKELHIEDRVTFSGRVDEKGLLEQYQNCDIFVLPSVWEGLPLTLMEAAASGLPVITTDVGGITSVFVHEENALIVRPGDVKQLARNMQKVVLDKELQNKLRINARMLAQNHSWENSAARLENVYGQLCQID